MKSFRQRHVRMNTGSMADIAFLLLIFFLVSTTISSEKGILRELPTYCDDPVRCNIDVKKRNLLEITLNSNNQILTSNRLIKLKDIKEIVKSFVDNDGLGQCEYCSGSQSKDMSEHPSKATILIRYNSKSSYNYFIAVQDKINEAYKELREAYALEYYKKYINHLDQNESKVVMTKYPIKISEEKI